jgi:cellulose synthase/poly-beta-1,6-N-acetylglucosamine synthase-like glycosyltransferase
MPPDAVTYLPIAVVGIWRWSVWLGKLCVARLYSPYSVSDEAVLSEFDVSIVTPVYRPDTDEFMSAVRSWHATDPHEIIVVIDAGDTEVIRRFREYADDHDDISCVVTPKPGKRPALVDGVRLASGDIVALVDDDVKWRPRRNTSF